MAEVFSSLKAFDAPLKDHLYHAKPIYHDDECIQHAYELVNFYKFHVQGIETLIHRYEDFERRYKESEDSREKCERELQDEKNSHQKTKKTLEESENKLANEKREHQKTRDNLKVSEDKLHKAQDDLAKTRTELCKARENYDSANKRADDSRRQRDEAIDSEKAANKRAREANEKAEKLEGERDNLNKKVDDLMRKLEKANASNNDSCTGLHVIRKPNRTCGNLYIDEIIYGGKAFDDKKTIDTFLQLLKAKTLFEVHNRLFPEDPWPVNLKTLTVVYSVDGKPFQYLIGKEWEKVKFAY